MKKIAILQSNYIPWKGYFDIISAVDTFILYDIVQYTKNDWRNRNIIKTKQRLKCLTIPIRYVSLSQRICDVRAANEQWPIKHWEKLRMAYHDAAFFESFRLKFEALYLKNMPLRLSDINYRFITAICEILNIDTPIVLLDRFERTGDKNLDLIKLCKFYGADCYLSGPSAKTYLDIKCFEMEGISVQWMDYNGYPEYKQLYPPFEHNVSILDLLFNEGPSARKFLKNTRESVATAPL